MRNTAVAAEEISAKSTPRSRGDFACTHARPAVSVANNARQFFFPPT